MTLAGLMKFQRVLPITLFLLFAPELRAELAVFSSGHFLRISSFEVTAGKARLQLDSGGALTVPLVMLERLIDDEVVVPAETAKIDEVAELEVELGFRMTDRVPETPFGQLIFDTAKRHAVNPLLVAAMIRAESAFDERAVSVKGARGLLQLMPATARRFGVPERRLFEPESNLEAGVRYIKWLRGRFSDDLPRVLAAYNAGEANVDRYGGVPPFRETVSYIRRIYSFLGLDSTEPL